MNHCRRGSGAAFHQGRCIPTASTAVACWFCPTFVSDVTEHSPNEQPQKRQRGLWQRIRVRVFDSVLVKRSGGSLSLDPSHPLALPDIFQPTDYPSET